VGRRTTKSVWWDQAKSEKINLTRISWFWKKNHVYADASNKQLGSVIIQEGKRLAFYSRKLNSAQKRYITGEQELLSIVETLKEFRDILLGQQAIVHTDHLNILYGKLSNDRIKRWRLLLEE
jgi:hypothetical protein